MLEDKARLAFRNLLVAHDYTDNAIDALWKWYDSSVKKGVASF